MPRIARSSNPREHVVEQPVMVPHAMLWMALASVVGFAVPAVFSTQLRWSRPVFLAPYFAIAGTLLVVHFRRHPMSLAQLLGHWRYGLAGAAAATFLLVRNVQGQPSSAMPEGIALVGALVWTGLAYGAIDGLLLNVLPVLAVQRAWPGARASRRERLIRGLLALGASLVVTTAYHLGYAEFRGPAVLSPIVGNTIITASYLVTGSPLAALVAHVAMHIAAVVHGMATTVQLPPHYGP